MSEGRGASGEWRLDGRVPKGDWVGPLPPTDGAWMEPHGLRVMMMRDVEPEQISQWRMKLAGLLIAIADWCVERASELIEGDA